jgi:hypothetical protein
VLFGAVVLTGAVASGFRAVTGVTVVTTTSPLNFSFCFVDEVGSDGTAIQLPLAIA